MNVATESPSSIPVTPQIAPQLVTFKPPRRSFTIINGSEKDKDVGFAGNIFTIPGKHKVVAQSDTDEDGDKIPGTFVLEDVYVYSESLGAEFMVMNAERAVIHILGIQRRPDGSGSELTSNFAIKGLSLLPRHAPKSLWQEVAKAGEHRSFLSAVKSAQETISLYDLRNEQRRAAGNPAIPSNAEYRHCVHLLREFDRIVRTEAEEAVSPYVEEAEAEKASAELEFQVFMKARVQELVDKAAEKHKIDKKALFDELMTDPETRKYAQTDWNFRRKGFDKIPEEELDRLAEEGLAVEDPMSEVEKAQRGRRK